jgi:ribosomal protein L19
MLRKTRLALLTIIVVRRDTSRRNVIAYIRTRSLS